MWWHSWWFVMGWAMGHIIDGYMEYGAPGAMGGGGGGGIEQHCVYTPGSGVHCY